MAASLLALLVVKSLVARLNEPEGMPPVALPALATSLSTTPCHSLNLTMCTRSCDATVNTCASFSTPVGKCWNPNALFPNSTLWGTQDIQDELSAEGTSINRTLFFSSDGSCAQPQVSSLWPLASCTGPFSDSRPFGLVECEADGGDGDDGRESQPATLLQLPMPTHVRAEDDDDDDNWRQRPRPPSSSTTTTADGEAPPPSLCHYGDPFRADECQFDELNVSLPGVAGAMCAPQCETNDDCVRALSASCLQMHDVRPLCALGVGGMKVCGLFCGPHAARNRGDGDADGAADPPAFCDDDGLATCGDIPGSQRSVCMFTQ